jgi:hypothetical protein
MESPIVLDSRDKFHFVGTAFDKAVPFDLPRVLRVIHKIKDPKPIRSATKQVSGSTLQYWKELLTDPYILQTQAIPGCYLISWNNARSIPQDILRILSG